MLVDKVETDPKRNMTLSVRQSLVQRIELYRALYKETYGDSIERSELIERLLEAALGRDRDFRRYEREQQQKGQPREGEAETAGADGSEPREESGAVTPPGQGW